MTKITRNLVVGLFSILSLAACGGIDQRVDGILPDETEQEQVVPDSGSGNSGFEESLPGDPSQADILRRYAYVDKSKTINPNILSKALIFYHNNQSRIDNKNYLSVIDFSLRSTVARFFIINMQSGEVWAIHTAHGRGSDEDHDGYADQFSNVSGSNASSLGYYLTAETYDGSHGLSLRLDGLSSTNSQARARAVVIHGADYVSESSVIQGRSWGCPAVASELRTQVINMLKGGSLIYAAAE